MVVCPSKRLTLVCVPGHPDTPPGAHYAVHGNHQNDRQLKMVQPLLNQSVQAAAEAVGVWLEKADYAGQDPYQLAARANAAARYSALRPLLNVAKHVVKALHSHLPASLFTSMPAVVIPQALSYVLSAEALTEDSPTRTRRLQRIVTLLGTTRSAYSPHIAWGLPFTWRDGEIYPPNWPVAFSSSVVGHGLLDAKHCLAHAVVEEWITGLVQFLCNECGVVNTPSGVCFRFVKGSDSPIINGCTLTAAFIARAAALLGDNKARDMAREAMAFVIDNQNDDGSWLYAAAYADKAADLIIDNRHSGYILDGLKMFDDADPNHGLPIQSALNRGWEFYSTRMIVNGMTKWDPDTLYPIDGHDLAQALVTTTLLGKYEVRNEVLSFALKNLYDGNGQFFFKLFESGKINRSVFIRWTQAPFYRALRMFLASSASLGPDHAATVGPEFSTTRGV